MKVKKVITLGKFARSGEHFKDGDILQILDEGREQEGEFGIQTIFKVRVPSEEEMNLSFNQTSMNHLIDSFGDNTEDWIGKNIKAWVIKQNVAGKFRNVTYLTAPDQELEGMSE